MMTPAQREVFARIARRIRRRDPATSPYGPDDDINAVAVRVDLGGAFTGPKARREHRAEAFRQRSERMACK